MNCSAEGAPVELSWFTMVMSVLLGLLIVGGNLLIIVAVVKDPLQKLHTPFNYFLVNLAVSDLMVGIVTMPISTYVHYREATRPVNLKMAITVLHLSYFISATCSFLSLVALSTDRYFAVTQPIKYRFYLNWKSCFFISLTIWILSLLFPFVYLQLGYIRYLMIYANSAIFFGSIVLALTYFKIYTFLTRRTREIERRKGDSNKTRFYLKKFRGERNVTHIFLLILTCFILLYIPVTCVAYILMFCQRFPATFTHVLRDAQFLVVCAQSGINPLICTLRLRQFKSSIKALLNRGGGAKPQNNGNAAELSNSSVSMNYLDTKM